MIVDIMSAKTMKISPQNGVIEAGDLYNDAPL
jgi:hypothetical protein